MLYCRTLVNTEGRVRGAGSARAWVVWRHLPAVYPYTRQPCTQTLAIPIVLQMDRILNGYKQLIIKLKKLRCRRSGVPSVLWLENTQGVMILLKLIL